MHHRGKSSLHEEEIVPFKTGASLEVDGNG
jgi:hypothetical protein